MNHNARYPYLNCIDEIEQQSKQTNKCEVDNRFRQWVWVGQALPKRIILGMFKSEGLEEPIKYGCLTTSALIYLRSECVSPLTDGARTMAFIISGALTSKHPVVSVQPDHCSSNLAVQNTWKYCFINYHNIIHVSVS